MSIILYAMLLHYSKNGSVPYGVGTVLDIHFLFRATLNPTGQPGEARWAALAVAILGWLDWAGLAGWLTGWLTETHH